MLFLILNFCFNLVLLLIFFKLFLSYVQKIKKEELSLLQKNINEQHRYDQIRSQNDKIEDHNHKLEQLSNATASLYEISKDLNSSLKLIDKAPMLHHKVWNILHCSEVKLILSTQEDAHTLIAKKTILISRDDLQEECESVYAPPSITDQKACEMVSKNNMTELLILDTKTNYMATELNLEPTVYSFMAIPLKVKGETLALMTIKNIEYENIEKSRVIAAQLALDVQKNMLYEKVEQLSITDDLTQLYLRRHFMARFQEELNRSIKQELSLSCIMVDIDHFKSYNDTHGHLIGDEILKELARILCNNVREIDLVGRLGGEEFCIFLPETNLESAYLIAERIRKDVEQSEFEAYDQVLSITISLGVSAYPNQADTLSDLINHADQCLYKAKNNGRNQVCCPPSE